MTALYLRQIAFVARKLTPVMDDLEAVLGLNVCFRDDGVAAFGLENALVPVGSQFIEVVAPTEDGTAGGRYLDRRGGDGGYMIICQCENEAEQSALRTRVDNMNIRVPWGREHEWGRFMQLHPADTGGTFFEIDYADPFEPEGLWPPAGGPAENWQDTINTEIVSQISVAELQSPDPLTLAERWAAIADLPLTREGGCFEIALANASIRFVEAKDGRGEGLGGLDLKCASPDIALAAARGRGLPTSDNMVLLGGVRLNLT